jgi:hypothetical protein
MLLQKLHTISAHVPPSMPLKQLVQLLLVHAGAAAEKIQNSRHDFLQVSATWFARWFFS